MIAIGRRSVSVRTRRERPFPNGAVGVKSDWMLTSEDPKFSPTVFLYEQPPGSILPAHFHYNNEFQIFIEGDGKIGPRTISPVTVHYAGAYTAYGPLAAGPQGLKYFTVRTVFESGAVRVNKSEGKWPTGPRRQATSKPLSPRAACELASLVKSCESILLPRTEDGLFAAVTELPPDTELAPIVVGAGDGAFVFILAGSILNASDRINAYESLYFTSDEAPTLTAADSGAQLLTLICPKRDPAYS